MKSIEIKNHHWEAFKDICNQFGVTFDCYWGKSRFDSCKKVRKVVLHSNLSQNWLTITDHIMYQSKWDRTAYATVYYSLYSCGVMTLKNHPYSMKSKWDYENPGMELDHKMPKSHYPELTFNPSNWQPLTREENDIKSDKVLKKEALEHLGMLKKVMKQKTASLMF